jgi:tRNA pseudouridine38-40 synthase
MARIALGLEYDGTAFAGWQTQPHARSVQDELQRAVSTVADRVVQLTAAGRTDAGVHALMQVAHFDSEARREPKAWVLGTNRELPPEIAVLWAVPVPEEFHARYSALSRTYLYRIVNQPCRPALLRRQVCWVRRPLDAVAMHVAAQALLGEHDFSAFRAAECQSAGAWRRMMSIRVERSGVFITITVRANAFLHHMVRNIAGALIAVGTGRRPVPWVAELLGTRDRRQGGATAPAQGLYLVHVEYPPGLGLPPPGVVAPCRGPTDV